jgi:hypothetical protein
MGVDDDEEPRIMVEMTLLDPATAPVMHPPPVKESYESVDTEKII